MSDEREEFLQLFLDESEEQIERISELLLQLEDDPSDATPVGEAFRLLHTFKGSAGMMGYESAGRLAHAMEDRFDEFRNGTSEPTPKLVTLFLTCIDTFRDFLSDIRDGGEGEFDAASLIARVKEDAGSEEDAGPAESDTTPDMAADIEPGGSSQIEIEFGESQPEYLATVRFRDGLPLADLKARLILSKLGDVGDVIDTEPNIDEIGSFESLELFSVTIRSFEPKESIAQIARVDGVESVEINTTEEAGAAEPDTASLREEASSDDSVIDLDAAADSGPAADLDLPPETFGTDKDGGPRAGSDSGSATFVEDSSTNFQLTPDPPKELDAGVPTGATFFEPAPDIPENPPSPLPTPTSPKRPVTEAVADVPASPLPSSETVSPAASGGDPSGPAKAASVNETVRVDVERLDRLMNLAGELTTTKARFIDLAERMRGLLGSTSVLTELRQVADRLESRLSRDAAEAPVERTLQDDLESLRRHIRTWTDGRDQTFALGEAVDQLNRLSGQIQSGVLSTRMVPLGPLFGRFRRVVRDLCVDRAKQVKLVLEGEQTEIDKRMVDELSDPLLHLVRNCVDHGIEPVDVRRAAGKPAEAVVRLSASQSGRHVVIQVSDDGAGIRADLVRARAIERGLINAGDAERMSNAELFDLIWRPGFSTAKVLSDVSGRGVGMDVVRSRIQELAGSVEIETEPGRGTTFTIRLPLTLAIVRGLLVRVDETRFAVPLSEVREIVPLTSHAVHNVYGRRTIDLRDQYIPLARLRDMFQWGEGADDRGQAVLIESGSRRVALEVDEVIGNTDLVIKSLEQNFRPVTGLSGASILGDGTVCLVLDAVSVVSEGAGERLRSVSPEAE